MSLKPFKRPRLLDKIEAQARVREALEAQPKEIKALPAKKVGKISKNKKRL